MRSNRLNLILLLVFVLLLPGLFWGLPTAINFQVDSPVPLGSLLFFADRRPEINTTYPAFHELLMLPFYGVAFVVYRLMGGFSRISSAWPYGLHNVSGLFTALMIITNVVAAVMGTAMLWISLKFVEPVKKWAWFALLFLGTNAIFVYYSRVGNLDIPYNFWLALMLFFVWRFLILGFSARSSLIPAGIAAAFAIGSKDQASGMAIGICVLLLCIAPKPNTAFSEKFRNAFLFGSAMVAAYALTAILPNPGRWYHHLIFVTGPHAPTNIPLTPGGEVLMLGLTLEEIQYAFTLPILILCLIGAWEMWRRGLVREFWILVAPLIGFYVVVIVKTRVVYPRFMIPFMVPVLVFLTYGVVWIAAKLPQRRMVQCAWAGALVAFLVYQFVVGYFPVTYVELSDTRRQLAADLPSLVPPGGPLLIARMQSENYPNANVYENYQLMHIAGDPIRPLSRHTANIFHPLDPNVHYYLLGTGGAGLPWHTPIPTPPLQGELVKGWRYPEWIRQHIRVPCLYEFYLYRATGPLPVDWVSPPFEN